MLGSLLAGFPYDTLYCMMTAKFLNEFAKQFSESLPPPLKTLRQEFEQQFHRGLKLAFEKLDLVTGEEFKIQTEVLARAREKARQLEGRLAKLEAQAQLGSVDISLG